MLIHKWEEGSLSYSALSKFALKLLDPLSMIERIIVEGLDGESDLMETRTTC